MEIALLLVLIVLNGVFAMSELALVAARPTQLSSGAAAGHAGAAAALALKSDPTRFLSTVQIGITSISILNGIAGQAALAGPLAEALRGLGIDPDFSEMLATMIIVMVITYLSIVVGELVPKRIAQVAPARIAQAVAIPMNWLARAVGPFVWLLSASTELSLRLLRIRERAGPPITEEEIHAMLAEGSAAGVIQPGEHEMVRNVLDLDDYRINIWMTPRGELRMLDSKAPVTESLRLAAASDQTVFPVYEAHDDNIVGTVAIHELAGLVVGGSEVLPASSIKSALFVPESLSGREMLETFQSTRAASALVVDEYGDLQGFVTLTGLMMAVSGDLGLGDDERPAVQREDGSWLFDGTLAIGKARELLGLRLSADSGRDEFDTVAGMMLTLLGRLANVGDHHDWKGWRFEVVDVDGRRIDRVLASRITVAAEPTEPA